ncbi:MAG: hypothetical protein ABIK95_12790 [Acidobacteriota bacterium]
MLITPELFKKIDQILVNILEEFQLNKAMILTEDDLKCTIVRRLFEIPELSIPQSTQNIEILSYPVHTEIPWYDASGKLTIKPDITILDPKNLSILHGCYGKSLPLPSKQCEFAGPSIIFELKYIRNKTGIRKATFEGKICEDFKKVQKLFDRMDEANQPNALFCYFVVFNKTDIKCRDFEEFLVSNKNSYRHKLVYGSSNVKFL